MPDRWRPKRARAERRPRRLRTQSLFPVAVQEAAYRMVALMSDRWRPKRLRTEIHYPVAAQRLRTGQRTEWPGSLAWIKLMTISDIGALPLELQGQGSPSAARSQLPSGADSSLHRCQFVKTDQSIGNSACKTADKLNLASGNGGASQARHCPLLLHANQAAVFRILWGCRPLCRPEPLQAAKPR